jgi:hypothetical protein
VKNVVDSFIALGMSDLDAWRCVHVMQGRSCLVLLRMSSADAPAPERSEDFSYEDISAAVEHGAAWCTLGPGRWQYARRVDWSLDQLKQMREELDRFANASRPDADAER